MNSADTLTIMLARSFCFFRSMSDEEDYHGGLAPVVLASCYCFELVLKLRASLLLLYLRAVSQSPGVITKSGPLCEM